MEETRNQKLVLKPAKTEEKLIESELQRYPPDYRSHEMQFIANWMKEGISGCVVGLPGTGRSTFLRLISTRPDALKPYLQELPYSVHLVPIDLNILPDLTPATFYRTLLRAFYRARQQFSSEIAEKITSIYQRHSQTRDPFLSQTGLIEILDLLSSEQIRISWVLNRFDEFCQRVPFQTAQKLNNTLRGLRDHFKDTLCIIVGTKQQLRYALDPPSVGLLYPILDTNVCWIGPLKETDARHRIRHRLQNASLKLSEKDVTYLWQLTGGYPSLIVVVCHWWKTERASELGFSAWQKILLEKESIRHRLQEIWHSLTQEEQFVLSEVVKLQAEFDAIASSSNKADSILHEHSPAGFPLEFNEVLQNLQKKGVCVKGSKWQLQGDIFQNYIAKMTKKSRGKIWFDKQTDNFYQGQKCIDSLAPLERSILQAMINNPQKRLSYTEIIEDAWPQDTVREGVSTEALYQHIKGLRQKIEPHRNHPLYIINWRGQPEGGYQFFPEGRPKQLA